MSTLINHTTTAERMLDIFHHIDAGFMNRRKAYSFLSDRGKAIFDEKKMGEGDYWADLQNDHLLITLCLIQCKQLRVPSLSELLHHISVGRVFASTEKVQGNRKVYTQSRCRNKVLTAFRTDNKVFLDYSPRHIYSDTQRFEMAHGAIMSIIGHVTAVNGQIIIVHPIVMGPP